MDELFLVLEPAHHMYLVIEAALTLRGAQDLALVMREAGEASEE